MKVLIINKFLHPNGGSETYIFKIGKQLQDMGHEVQFFGMEHEGRCVGNRAESYTSDMDFHTGKLGKLLYPFKIIYSTEARKKLRVVLKDFMPDVVHVNNFNFQLTPSILYEIRDFEKKNNHKIKIIYTAHDSQLVCPNHLMQQFLTGERCTRCIGGSPWNCAKYKCIHGSFIKSLLGSVEAWIYRKLGTYGKMDAVICPSKFLQEKLNTSPQLKDKTVVMHNFVDGIETDDSDTAEGQVTEPYVAYVGRFSEEKGIGTLLKVCKNLPEIPFVFAGSGPLADEVNEVPNVTNKGFLQGEELKKLMQDANFVIFPSECNENCPFTVMEALSYGTPVIGGAIGGVPELIRNGENGLLFESGNAEQLQKMIADLWQDKAWQERLREGCAKEKFDDLKVYCEKLLELYKL